MHNNIKFCFILGIDRRSGTNYLFRLIRKHPQCLGPGPIWEDFFIHNSDIVKDYVLSIYKSWKPTWEIDKILGPPSLMLRYLGDALKEFLCLQLKDLTTLDHSDMVLLSKTPSVVGIDNFFELFPEDFLIVLIRDGRSVVESGVRSFAWDYEEAMYRWANNAKIIFDFKEKHKDKKNFLILRYEDIVLDTQRELNKIFNLLGIDNSLYDFQEAENLGVTGSSDLKKIEGTMHWKPVPKPKDFNPIERFKDWDDKTHARFNWIAEKYLRYFGYKPKQINSHFYTIRNILLDILWKIKQIKNKWKNTN